MHRCIDMKQLSSTWESLRHGGGPLGSGTFFGASGSGTFLGIFLACTAIILAPFSCKSERWLHIAFNRTHTNLDGLEVSTRYA